MALQNTSDVKKLETIILENKVSHEMGSIARQSIINSLWIN